MFNNKLKTQLAEAWQRNKELEAIINKIGGWTYEKVQRECSILNMESKRLKAEVSELKQESETLKNQIYNMNEDLEFESYGFSVPAYDCMNSEWHAEQIKILRSKQKEMVKNKTALHFRDDWILGDSKKQGQAMNNDNMKMVLRAFNNECDVLISKVKYNNEERIAEKIEKAAEAIDKLNKHNQITITKKYIKLKLKELHEVWLYQEKKQEEKEELKRQRAEEKEQQKVEKELAEKRKIALKEQKHYELAKQKYTAELKTCKPEEKTLVLDKLAEIDNHIETVNTHLKEIDYRDTNQRAGYVYIISNIGSFGKDVYKIGMTRRLEPMDRIDELSSASVPFSFDVHAMIFSDDAPTLEANLHKEFADKRINLMNNRKEFFHVTLDEIKKAVKKYNENMIEIAEKPEAKQYYESLALRQKNHINPQKDTYISSDSDASQPLKRINRYSRYSNN